MNATAHVSVEVFYLNCTMNGGGPTKETHWPDVAFVMLFYYLR